MKIVIDCRFWGLENTGIGRYSMNLVQELVKLDKDNSYFLLFRKDMYERCLSENKFRSNFMPILADWQPYTFGEQIGLARLLYSLKPDVYHAVDLNIPVFWKGNFVVTIHDLTRLQSINKKVTTLPLPIYWLKFLVVKYWVIKQAVGLSKNIIVPSKCVREEIADRFTVIKSKIVVTYEAPDDIYYKKASKQEIMKASNLLKTYDLTVGKYIIYTGNAYPHKNLHRLIKALSLISDDKRPQLAIVCGRNVFREKIENLVHESGMDKWVKFLGFVDDTVLRELYRSSLAFITPSLSEGFGLPGLEAMAAGTLVLSSNASCLSEIYGDHAIYFDAEDVEDICNKITDAMRMKKMERDKMIDLSYVYVKGFRWNKMVKETLKVYNSFLYA